MTKLYSAKECKDVTGVTLRQLQWWDERGILSPAKKDPIKLYTDEQMLWVAIILWLSRSGMSIQRIRQIERIPLPKRCGHLVVTATSAPKAALCIHTNQTLRAATGEVPVIVVPIKWLRQSLTNPHARALIAERAAA